jgi:hypothetical protein
MAEETKTQVATDVAMADDETTRLETASAEPAVADSNSAEGGDSATVGEGAEGRSYHFSLDVPLVNKHAT